MKNIKHALSVISDFSVGESMLQVGTAVELAKSRDYESIALVDTMSIHGMVDFANKAKKVGIRSIIGCRVRVYENPNYRKPPKASGEKEIENPFFCLKVYVQDERGIKSLMKLLSKGYSAENFYYHARVGLSDVLELEGVAVSTGDFQNLFHSRKSAEVYERLRDKFGRDNVYVELVPIDTPLFDTLNARAINLIRLHSARSVVTYPAMYGDCDDAPTLEVLKAITTNTQMSVSYRPKQHVKDFALNGPGEILKRVKGGIARSVKWYGFAPTEATKIWLDAVDGIEALSESCHYKFEKKEVCLPKMAESEFSALGRKCVEGWRQRFAGKVLGYMPSAEVLKAKYKPRLEYELGVLNKMGFSGYFLLVEDLVMWAKRNGVIVGPGRGSVGGSLVAYLLGITDVDPIRFNLLFERFINPERMDLPDADLDFMSSKRHLVIEYLTEKYGKDRVAGISNYSTLASASALRDTGRMFGMSGIDLTATKLVPKEHGQSFTLTEAAKTVPEIDKFRLDEPEVWTHALKLEGAMRSFGTHAAGVIVAGEPLIERAVVETRGEMPVVNWDKRVVEDWGLIKMDLLGLSTLDVLEIARTYIKDRHGVSVDYLKLSLDDEKVMDAFGRGDTTGVFQFESPGMKKLLRSLAEGGRLTFDDITAATALYRPGPMDSGLMDDFVQIKRGYRSPSYEHQNMETALKDTYSVIVYQEQVMQVAVDLAGFTRAEADFLRKAMGKKDKDKMAEMRQKWVDGCEKMVYMSESRAGALFDKIEAFAGYGFNKSHAVEYSIISFWTMWVRCNYPAEYFAACMSIVKDDKLPGLVKDARECEIEILPPDVNLSCDKFTIPDDKHILAPLSAVRGISENTALRIKELRERNRSWIVVKTKKKRDGTLEEIWGLDASSPLKGRFETAEEFRMAAAEVGSKVNSACVENLNLVGALASVTPGSKPPRHPDRRKDQTELMPGLIIDPVKAGRQTDMGDKFLRAKVVSIVREYKSCSACDLSGSVHPSVRCKTNVKFMVVTDCPSWEEEKEDKLLVGQAGDFVKAAIADAGLSVAEGYYTTVVKARKNDKFLTNGQLNGCRGYLERELELIKPPIIVALGSAAIKHFVPGIKGSTAELAGKAIYSSKFDAMIVCGINPQQCVFDPSKGEVLVTAFKEVADILS
jgi:uracil-DNA glycosylase family 4